MDSSGSQYPDISFVAPYIFRLTDPIQRASLLRFAQNICLDPFVYGLFSKINGPYVFMSIMDLSFLRTRAVRIMRRIVPMCYTTSADVDF